MPSRPAPALVSVIVPVLDAAESLEAQLSALSTQDYKGEWELIVADNGSTDRSAEIARRWARRMPRARLVAAESDGRGPNLARNAGARVADGDFLAFCDADDMAEPGWLTALVEAGREAGLVAGRLDVERLNDPAVREWHETPPWEKLNPLRRFMPVVSTANLGIWSEVFREIGAFRRDAVGAEDKELAWRAQLGGHRVAKAPEAVVAYRYRRSARATARQHFGWGLAAPRLYRRFRGSGLARTRLRDALRGWTWLALTLPLLPVSRRRRGLWAVQAGLRAGRLVGSIHNRVVFL